MPGFIIHMAAAKEYLRLCSIRDETYINDYIVGSVAPDIVAGNNKKQSHFWSDRAFTQFVRKPDMNVFLEKHGDRINEPFVRGYYHHLIFDLKFLELYWTKHFRFFNDKLEPAFLYDEVTQVKLIDNGRIYPRKLFFSEEMYYGDYTRMNSRYIERYGLRNLELKDCQAIIENDGFSMERVRTEIDRVMRRKKIDEPLMVFVLEEMDRLIANIATEFLKWNNI
ncbi:MAG: hypothetical protein NC428_06670 [Clostridium sp.]|nr:hypothetical protein [Clostridium sp.]